MRAVGVLLFLAFAWLPGACSRKPEPKPVHVIVPERIKPEPRPLEVTITDNGGANLTVESTVVKEK